MSVGASADDFIWIWLWTAVVIRAATVLDERGNKVALRSFAGFLLLLLLLAVIYALWTG